MTIELKNVSVKRVLLTMAETLDNQAEKDKVVPRKDALRKVAKSLVKLGSSRSVTKLLDYME